MFKVVSVACTSLTGDDQAEVWVWVLVWVWVRPTGIGMYRPAIV